MKYDLMDRDDVAAYYPIINAGPWGTVFTELGLDWQNAFFYENDNRNESKHVFFVRDWDAFVLSDLTGRYGSSLDFGKRISWAAGKKTLVLYGLPELGKYNINVVEMSPYAPFAAYDEVYHLLQCSGCEMIDLVKLVRPKVSEDIKEAHIDHYYPGALYRTRIPMCINHPPKCPGGVPTFTHKLRAAFQKGLDDYYHENV